MFAVARIAGLFLCLAGFLAAGCGPASTSSPAGTPPSKPSDKSGKPVVPEEDRGRP
jgi:hypothetical protein